MTDTAAIELQRLLDRVIPHVAVSWPSVPESMDALSAYKVALCDERRLYAPDVRSDLLRYRPKIRDQSREDELRQFIRNALSEYFHEDRIQLAIVGIRGGTAAAGTSIDDLIHKLIDLSFVLGTGKTADLFVEAMSVPVCTFWRSTLLGGIALEHEIELYDCVRVVPLSESPVEWPVYLPGNILTSELKERFRGAVLLVDEWSVSPRFMNPTEYVSKKSTPSNDHPFSVTHRSRDVTEFLTLEFCRALSLVTGSKVYPSLEWRHVSEDEVVNIRSFRNRVDYWEITSPENRVSVARDQVNEALQLYESLTSLNPTTRTSLAVPIDRLIASTSAKAPVDRVIDLGIALESLYLSEERNELVFRLRTRAAKHLEYDLDKRRELSNLLKAFYNARSDAVHTGMTPEGYKVQNRGQVPVANLIAETHALCRSSILKMLGAGIPDWGDLDLQ